MATAARKNRKGNAPPSQPKPAPRVEPKRPPFVVRAFDAVFRFLASLKLAVICLASLAGALAYGTYFIRDFGQNAANDYVFQTRGFALLLAFLATNVLCAALIRYPWKVRQTGFLITHVGLLMVIGGSWWAFQQADEGLIGMKEGESSSQVIRTHKQAIYVEPVDPHSGKSLGKYSIPFQPGAWDWPEGKYEVLSSKGDPFKLAVKRYYAASIPRTIFVPDPDGSPMIKLRPQILPPGGTDFRDIFRSEQDKWFAPGRRGNQRVVRDVGPAQFVFTFTERHDLFDDFLNPPANPGKEGVARLRYPDKAGKERIVDVRIDDIKPDTPVPLPDSDLTATYSKVVHLPIEDPEQRQLFGEDVLNIVQFKVKKGNGPELEHNGYASMPMLPPLVPKQDADPSVPRPDPYLLVNYYCPPLIDKAINGRTGQVEILGDDHGKLAYRVYGQGNPAELRAVSLFKPGEEILAFDGTKAPMKLKFTVDEFLQGGRKKEIAESVTMPVNQQDNAMPAILAELTVGGRTQEVWLRKSPGFDPDYTPLAFGDSMYKVALDVDRVDLGFTLTLKDFEVGFDPGTEKPSSYESDIRLTDEDAGIKDQPVSIYMNHTFDYKGWRFFQTSFTALTDPETDRKTGEFISVFQASKNPARVLVYGGCIIVVLGAFVQFYMRSGVFSDGGKLQHERAEKARRRLEAKSGKAIAATPTLDDGSEPL